MSLKQAPTFGHRQSVPKPPVENLDQPRLRTAESEERRRAPRERCLLLARVVYGQPEQVTEAIVRNISETGALLEISAAVVLPPVVTILIERRRLLCNARIAWRRGGSAGLAWESEPVTLDPADGGALLSIARQVGLQGALLNGHAALRKG